MPDENNQQQNSGGSVWGGLANLANQIAAAGAAQTAQYQPPARYRQVNGKWEIYDGPGVIDTQGNLLTKDGQTFYYNSDYDAGSFYASLTPGTRAQILGTLNDKGFYRSGKPGDFASDVNAIGLAMEYANIYGISIDRAINEISANIPSQGGGGGSGAAVRFRVSNPDEIKLVAKQVSQDTLGREFTPAELDKFAATFRQQELGYQQAAAGGATVVTEPPSAQVSAQSFAQQVAPTEANAYKYLGYVNKFFQAVGA